MIGIQRRRTDESGLGSCRVHIPERPRDSGFGGSTVGVLLVPVLAQGVEKGKNLVGFERSSDGLS